MEVIGTSRETDVLRGLVTDSVTGYEPSGYADWCWILHAIWELDDEGRRVRWVRWADLVSGAGRDLSQWGQTLSTRVFEGIPTEGMTRPETVAPDRDSLTGLIEILARFSPDGLDTGCFWAQSPLENIGEAVELRRGPLGEAVPLRDGIGSAGFPCSFPVNWWPADRSWFVYSDSDLSATEVHGSKELIAAILADSSFEAVRYPHVSEPEVSAPESARLISEPKNPGGPAIGGPTARTVRAHRRALPRTHRAGRRGDAPGRPGPPPLEPLRDPLWPGCPRPGPEPVRSQGRFKVLVITRVRRSWRCEGCGLGRHECIEASVERGDLPKSS
ncbi:hypothetical protein GCM10023235_78510 [Kitasatospora terrestris]|uniref:DUF317 domain-containing protein n=1 Tax=Kitasatospora terrestris TaxID=258051 RepID=A0ABP9ESU4_9ACTN